MGQEQKEHTWNLIAKKLAGEASPEELLELERLLRNNPNLHYPIQAIINLWHQDNPLYKKDAENAFLRHLDRMRALNIDFSPAFPDQPSYPFQEASLNRKRRVLISMTATCLLIGISLVFLYSKRGPQNALTSHVSSTSSKNNGNYRENNSREIVSPNGSRTHRILPDGTGVWLNAGSRITYDDDFGNTLREVNLSGEAFFDVARNAEKPFVIHTDRVDIKVLGTSFNVRSYPAEKTTEATLLRGSIEVLIKDRPSEKIILKPNEKLIVANDDSTLQRPNPGQVRPSANNESLVTIRKPVYQLNTGTLIETSWMDNKLIFQDKEFGSLAKDLERWYGVSIQFTNPRQEEWRFTGTFQNETVEQALDALKLTANFTYTIQGTQIIIITKKD